VLPMKTARAITAFPTPLLSLLRLTPVPSLLSTQTFLAPVIKHPAAQQVFVSFLTDSSKYVPSEGGREGGGEGGVYDVLGA